MEISTFSQLFINLTDTVIGELLSNLKFLLFFRTCTLMLMKVNCYISTDCAVVECWHKWTSFLCYNLPV